MTHGGTLIIGRQCKLPLNIRIEDVKKRKEFVRALLNHTAYKCHCEQSAITAGYAEVIRRD
jgi:hypothetical protein